MATPDTQKRQAVRDLYNTYPFPPEPLLNEPPPGYNWRRNWIAAYNFCTGRKPAQLNPRILDAGCGTGVGTEYLALLNPQADIVAIDLSEKALEVAQQRLQQSGVAAQHSGSLEFCHLNLEAADRLEGEFDAINCVGVLHHLPDPVAGIQALAKKLAPGGIFHIFVYAELGRREIQLMQEAIALLQGEKRGDYRDGVAVGRQIFASLPENNRLVRREKERWSLENHRDESFADMYVHPQEFDYTIETLFALIDASDLDFVGFSNPQYWQVDRLLGNSPDLLARFEALGERDRCRLIELLDPEITHYEFFLSKPPLPSLDWADDETLLAATVERHPCMTGWESSTLLNFDYYPIDLSPAEFEFIKACDRASTSGSPKTVGQLLEGLDFDLAGVRSLQKNQLIVLSP